MDLGGRIVMARRAKGWTASRLADEAGISRQQLSRIEHGHSEPTDATLACISRALGAELVEAAGEPGSHVLKLWEMLSAADREQVLADMIRRVPMRSFDPADDALALAAR